MNPSFKKDMKDLPRIKPTHWLARTTNVFASFLLCVALLVFWRAFPGLDLAISETFFWPAKCPETAPDDKICGRFDLLYDARNRTIRTIGMRIPQIIMLVVVVLGVVNLVRGYDQTKRLWQLPAVGLIAMIIGPLLSINLFLKETIGRARPFQLERFGREEPFSLPGEFVENCVGNCSFPSGEAAAAFWLLFVVPFLPSRYRKITATVILVFAIAVSFWRVALGRHFASDVTFAAALSVFCLTLAFWLAARIPESWHKWRAKPASD